MFKKHFFRHSLRHYYPTRAAKKHSGGEKREGEFFLNSDIKYERIKTYHANTKVDFFFIFFFTKSFFIRDESPN
jgi:hypothetical protein